MDFISEGWSMFTSSIKSVAEKIKESDFKEDLQSLGKRIKNSQGWETVTSFISNITDFNDNKVEKNEIGNRKYNDYGTINRSNNNNEYINKNNEQTKATNGNISRNTRKGWYDDEQESQDINDKVDKNFVTEDSGWDDWDEW